MHHDSHTHTHTHAHTRTHTHTHTPTRTHTFSLPLTYAATKSGVERLATGDSLVVAVCCRVLQCAAMCCSMLQCVAVCCSVLQRVVACCSVLQCVTDNNTLMGLARLAMGHLLVVVWCCVLRRLATCCTVLQTIKYCDGQFSFCTYFFRNPPAPMNHVKIFKGWPTRDAPSKQVQLWYQTSSPDQRGQAEIKKPTRLSNKTSTA